MKNVLIKLMMSVGLLSGLSLGGATVATAAPHAADTTICYPFCTESSTTVPVTTPKQPTVTVTVPPAVNDGTEPAVASASRSNAAAQGSQSLAFTGSDVVGTVAIGAVLIGAGFLLTRLSRRRRHSA